MQVLGHACVQFVVCMAPNKWWAGWQCVWHAMAASFRPTMPIFTLESDCQPPLGAPQSRLTALMFASMLNLAKPLIGKGPGTKNHVWPVAPIDQINLC